MFNVYLNFYKACFNHPLNATYADMAGKFPVLGDHIIQ